MIVMVSGEGESGSGGEETERFGNRLVEGLALRRAGSSVRWLFPHGRNYTMIP